MATPSIEEVVAVNRAITTAKLVIQQYGQSERKLSDLTLAEQKAPIIALKTVLDTLVISINA